MPEKSLTYEFYDQDTANRRLAEIVLFVSAQSQCDPSFGKVKLNKILFFSDFQSYLLLGKPITGGKYMRQPKGPVPQQMVPVCESLEHNRALVFQDIPIFRYTQKRPIALRGADLREFDGEQIKILESVMDGLRDMNATEVSEFSHTRMWKAVKDGELIPYEAAYISDDPVTDRDREILRQLREEHGW